MSYTTTNAEVDSGEVVSGPCGGASSSSTTPGVWYQVKGTGRPLTASTCSEETTFDTQISVFRGGCGNLACVNGNNDFCGLQSTVVWPSLLGEIYHVLIHGSNGSTGQFELKISTDTERKVNDFCGTAETLVVGAEVTFAFSGSSADPDLPLCDDAGGPLADAGTTEFPYGIWYSVMGAGGIPISATVDSTSISPVTMNIYSGGGCGGLSCVVNQLSAACIGGGVFSRCQETACFEADLGEVYYVFVSTVSLEGIDTPHTLEIGSCVLSI
jgi:hypothetical protein